MVVFPLKFVLYVVNMASECHHPLISMFKLREGPSYHFDASSMTSEIDDGAENYLPPKP